MTVESGLGQGLADQRQQLAHVVARGQFGHHAAIFGVQFDLAVQGVREQAALAVVDGHPGFVAGGLDAEHRTGFCNDRCHEIECAARPRARVVEFNSGETMPSVKVRENEPFEFALRRFKRTCEKAGVLAEVRKREFYEKPTQERKRKRAAAVKRHLRRVSRDVTKRQRMY